jgi:hypothetical protein
MFDSVDEMYTYLCTQGQVDILSLVIEGLYSSISRNSSVLPLGVLVVFIDTNSLFVTGEPGSRTCIRFVRNECSFAC